jgi:hypothetical protein
MESLRLSPVAFCGENPVISLFKPGTDTITAAASYWHCTYSQHGEGTALLVYLDDGNALALNQPSIAVYSDNMPLARYLTDTFNAQFEDWKPFGFSGTPIQQARFVRESDSRDFYRVACHAEGTRIDLHWNNLRKPEYRTFPDLFGGGFGVAGDEHYHVSNVIFLCEQGSISINGKLTSGAAQTRTTPEGRFSSSVFVALSETWIKLEK